MPDPNDGLTERQKKWLASVREGLMKDTGRSLEEWVEIARSCRETKPRARQLWLKEKHGIGQNRAALILDAAFPPEGGWSKPDKLEDALWRHPASRAIFDAVRAAALRLPDVVVGQRREYTAFSRKVQFAAVRPQTTGRAVLGLAVTPDASPRLAAPKREPWSERLKSTVQLASSAAVDTEIELLLRTAWGNSG
jgi:uncharacterized protein DUF5655/uncharacterized protein DUF4287